MGQFIEVDDPGLIEKEENAGCGCGCTNPNCSCNSNGGNESDDPAVKPEGGLDLFGYLNNFDKMSELEKAQLLLPMTYFMYPDNIIKPLTSAAVSEKIAEVSVSTGRAVDDIQFTISHQGIYTIMVVFKPLHLPSLPTDIRTKIVNWATSNGMLKLYDNYGDAHCAKTQKV